MIALLRRRPPVCQPAEQLYAAIVAGARRPELYTEGGVPDSLEGRFEMLVVHAALVLRRLRGEGEDGQALAQETFDRMFADLDRTLREMGVGDLAVPRRIRTMAEAFFGRARALDAALAEANRDDAPVARIAEVLERNVFADAPGASAGRLAELIWATQRALAAQPAAGLLAGRLDWPDAASP